jgi:glycosyltransferase involved in cell wall biosynthesis
MAFNVKNLPPSFSVIAPVSVVIPCFRCASTIKRAIASIMLQTQKPAEIILVDDSSGDNTLIVLQELAKHYDEIKIIALAENQGAANARNVGWAVATQPYIAFLDADDAWHSQKIEIQTAYMNAHPEVVLCGHGYKIIEDSATLPDWPLQTGAEHAIPKWSWLLSNQFSTTSVMLQRDVDQRFLENQRYSEDYLLWLAFVCSGCTVMKLSAELAARYENPFGISGLSAKLWAMEQGELSNYQYLFHKGYINLAQWLLLSVFSLLKFVRRLVIYWSCLRWKN